MVQSLLVNTTIVVDIQGVPQNCIHFVFADFSASRAPQEIGEDILE